jgi:hypothetical protein
VDGGKRVSTLLPKVACAAFSAARRVGIVDDGRNAALEFVIDGDAVHGGRSVRQAADLLLQLIAHFGRIGARGARRSRRSRE